MKPKIPFVTIVIPTFNEERFIIPMLESLGCLGGSKCLQSPHEIIVVDGGSTDGTLDILSGFTQETGIRVINNPLKIQAAGVNLAARKANPQSEYLIRIDAHAIYEPDFVHRVARTLVETGASSVVVPLITRPYRPKNMFAWAVTAAQRSKLGNGGSAHRLEDTPAQWVDHGHHAGFDLAFFKMIGGYDDTFATNEDAEYDVRVTKAGGRIWYEPRATVWYSPRETLTSLARQYFRYGKGRASTTLKHAMVPKPRQMFPILALLANLASIPAGFFHPIFWGIPALYGTACAVAAVLERRAVDLSSGGVLLYCKTVAALVTMHMSWAAGFACEVFKSMNIMRLR